MPDPTQTSAEASDLNSQLARIQKLLGQQEFEKARQQLEAVLSEAPENIEALYMMAVCSRYLALYIEAQKYLDQLFDIQLEHGRAHQEQGYLLQRQNQLKEALGSFERATHINPALEASWREQAKLCRALGLYERAQQPLAQLRRLSKLPKALIAITDLLSQGQLAKAENLCRSVLQRQPQNAEAMRLLANIGSRMGAMQEAELLLESACAFEPDNSQVRIDYIQLLRRRQKFTEALNQSKQLLAADPDNPQFQSLYAIETLQTGDYATAIDSFNRVLQQLPDDCNTLTSRGHALKTAGSTDKAISDYRAAAQAGHCEAYYSLANLKTYKFDGDEIATMQGMENLRSLSLMDRVYLYFALGKAFEDQQQYQQSFEYYLKGNRLKKQQSGYSAEQMQSELERQRLFFTASNVHNLRGKGHDASDPIFILGLPRAGSTMLEQILSSHSQVDGTLELPNILAMSQELRRHKVEGMEPGYPDAIGSLHPDQLLNMGQRYIEETRIHRQQAPFFIDKMPNNFRHIGLIKTILPNAKIIDARRHPMACCFSAFKQLFAEGQEFSYYLSDIAHYYRDYVSLMNHWNEVFPDQIHLVHYEHVVSDLEGQVRKLLDYCGLPFEEQCVQFHKTERAVRTASSEQVRQPLYKSGVDQWRNFEPYLTEMQQLLETTVNNYPE